jgi:peptidyl-prolyl cis-trans isomerase SurA
MKYISLLLLAAFLSVTTINCSRTNKTLAELGDEKITLGEFEKQYLKTINNIDSARNKPIEDKRQFLNLYINFRLKVKDARERGLLNNAELQKDIEEYKKSLAPNFLIDKEVVEKQIQTLYERKKYEVRASHILINLSEKPTPEDSIAAYQRADSIIQKLKNGEDFGTLAEQYSMDRSAKTNRGDLYYFTGGATIQKFEDAVYDLSVDEFTKTPVRTIYGLHIIKLTDKKPRSESIRASHILIQDKRDSLGRITDSLVTYQRALEVYNKAKNKEDWNSLVQLYSEDPGTKNTAGDLGYFDRRRMAQPFDSAVFLLSVGEISEPIRTQYGWHIIYKTDEKKYQSFDKQEETLKNDYKRSPQYKEDYKKYVDELKEKYHFKLDDNGYNYFRAKFDSAKTIADYNIDSLFQQTERDKPLASFDGGIINIQDILNHLNVNRDFQRSQLTAQTIISIINSAAENPILIAAAGQNKIFDDDEFQKLVREYENGLLVFRVDQDELWSKVKLTEQEIIAYYDQNKAKFMTVDSLGQPIPKQLEQVKAEISNELQQLKYKETEKNYLESLKQKYPVKIYEDVLLMAYQE